MWNKVTVIAAAAALLGGVAACEDDSQDALEQREDIAEERVENQYEGMNEELAEEAVDEQYDNDPNRPYAGGTGSTAEGTTAGGTGSTAQGTTAGATGATAGTTGTTGQQGSDTMAQNDTMAQGGSAYGQQGTAGSMQRQGEPSSQQSHRNYQQTVAGIQRELRNNDMQVVGRVRLNQPQQQAQGAQAGQGAAKPGEQQQGRQRAELILFADPNGLGDTASDPMQALSMPTAVLVYEDALSGDVFVAYDDPSLVTIVQPALGQQNQQGQQQGAASQTEPQGTTSGQPQTRDVPEAGTEQDQGGTTGRGLDTDLDDMGTDQGLDTQDQGI